MAVADYIIKAGDTSPAYTDTLPVNLTGASVTFALRALTSAASLTTTGTVTVTSAATGAVTYTPSAADTATAGMYSASWQVTLAGGAQVSYPTVGYLMVSIEPSITQAAQQLVGLGDVKDYLDLPSNDRTHDAKLMGYISDVRPLIEMEVGPVLLGQYDEYYDGGINRITLRHRPSAGFGTSPVLNVLAISEYRGPVEYPLAIVASPAFGSIYSAMVNVQQGTVTRRTAGGGTLAFMPGRETVHIVYQAGQAVIPGNVRRATLEAIRINYETTQQMGKGRLTVADDQERGPALGFFLPRRCRELLAPTRRAPSIA